MTNAAQKVTNQDEIEIAQELGNETITVMRFSMPGSDLPDLILSSSKDIGDQLEWSFLGEDAQWQEFKPGTQITITFEEMPLVAFEQLPEWEA